MHQFPEAVRRLAEDPNTYTPLGPLDERIETEKFVIWLGPDDHPGATVVQRLRLRPDGVKPTLELVRAILRERGRRASTWEVSDVATPRDLVPRLEALGLVPDHEPLAVGMALADEPPAGPAGIEARAVASFAEYAVACEVMWSVFELAPEEVVAARARLERGWAAQDPARGQTFLAWLEGRPVAAATAVYAEGAVVLYAGSTLPEARGRGAYRALVRARWDEGVRRGTPVLVTHAGAMSRPILRRLGFVELSEIRILRDDHVGDSH